jgi:hypothetical protein
MENDPIYYIFKKGSEYIKPSIVTPDESTEADMQVNVPVIAKRFSRSEDEKLKEIKNLIAEFLIE